MRNVVYAVALAIAATSWGHAENEHEGRHKDAERASRGAQTGEFVPLARIVASVRQRYKGEIVETEFETEHGSAYYEFHILQPDGRLIEVNVDARTGRYLNTHSSDD